MQQLRIESDILQIQIQFVQFSAQRMNFEIDEISESLGGLVAFVVLPLVLVWQLFFAAGETSGITYMVEWLKTGFTDPLQFAHDVVFLVGVGFLMSLLSLERYLYLCIVVVRLVVGTVLTFVASVTIVLFGAFLLIVIFPYNTIVWAFATDEDAGFFPLFFHE